MKSHATRLRVKYTSDQRYGITTTRGSEGGEGGELGGGGWWAGFVLPVRESFDISLATLYVSHCFSVIFQQIVCYTHVFIDVRKHLSISAVFF